MKNSLSRHGQARAGITQANADAPAERARLGIGERVIAAAVRAPEGDQRPWPAIDAWADEIVGVLAQSGRSTLSLAT